MAEKGAPEKNTYAAKEITGKTISLYLPADVLPAIEKILRGRSEEASEKACIKEAKEYALAGIQEHIGPSPLADQLRFMVSNWQALANHAEVFAPELLRNDRWIALKVSLEQRTEEIGVTEFIRQVGERYRQQIEERGEEMSYTYALETSMSARANLDQKAANDAWEDTRMICLGDLALEQNEDLTDDPKEYRARYGLFGF